MTVPLWLFRLGVAVCVVAVFYGVILIGRAMDRDAARVHEDDGE